MGQLEKGDPADILQNVRWQHDLYSAVASLTKLESTRALLRRSTEFIEAYGERRVRDKDFPSLIGELLKAFRETAAAVEKQLPGLDEDVVEMEHAMGNLVGLQKAHRNILLKLTKLSS